MKEKMKEKMKKLLEFFEVLKFDQTCPCCLENFKKWNETDKTVSSSDD